MDSRHYIRMARSGQFGLVQVTITLTIDDKPADFGLLGAGNPKGIPTGGCGIKIQ